MKYLINNFILLIVIFVSFEAVPQVSGISEIINSSDGLSQNEVFCIHEDRKGFIWFGTQDGLNRYDGYTFRIYRPLPGDTNSLVDYAINAITEDENGYLWIATRSGLNRFNPETDEFVLYKIEEENSNYQNDNSIWKLLVDGEYLWLATNGGLKRLNRKTEEFTSYNFSSEDPFATSSDKIRDVRKDGDKLWIATLKGLNALDISSGRIEKYYNVPGENNSLSGNNIVCLASDNNGTLWAGTNNGLNQIKGDGSVRIFNFFPDQANFAGKNFILDIIFDNSGAAWIGTLDGLIRFNPINGTYYSYTQKEFPLVRAIHQDRSGIIWAGSGNKGILKINNDPNKFNMGQYSQSEPVVFNTFYLTDDNRIFAGGDNKLIVSELHTLLWGGKKNSFTIVAKSEEAFPVKTITTDDEGNYWTGSFGGGIKVYDRNLQLIKKYFFRKDDPESLSNNHIHKIFKDSKGNIWIGTGQGGLVKYLISSDSFIAYKNDPNDTTSISNNEVIDIQEDREGFLWLGTTTGGLNKFNPETGKAVRYYHLPKDKSSLTSNRINTLIISKDNTLWIGTFGGGLVKMDGENRFTYLGVNDGLSGNTVFSIEEDEWGNIWISTDKGISKFNSYTRTFNNYDAADGLMRGDFKPNSSITTKEGYIFFGGSEGYNYFHPDSIRDNNYQSPVVLTDFRIFNNSVPVRSSDRNEFTLAKNISYLSEIEIPYYDNVFSIEFASLHYAHPKRNSYAYFMEGFDNHWIHSGTRRFVTYTNLDPGTYLFRVKGSNSDGIWNMQETTLIIRITPPWWQTWWAYILYAAALFTILYIIRKYEMHRIRLRNELESKEFEAKKLQEIDQMKSRFFANISHEFRTPLTLILGIVNKYTNSDPNDDFRILRKNAQRLLQLINQLLELSKVESGSIKIEAEKTELLGFIKRIAASFLSYAEQKNLIIKINSLDISAVQKEEFYVYIDRQKIETVFYNLLSNAVKFTPEGEKIYIDTIPGKWDVEINITNTGTTIEEEHLERVFDRFYQADDSGTRGFEGTGIGLALVKELTELHKGEVSVRSIANKETTFSIKLRLGRAHFNEEEVIESEERDYQVTNIVEEYAKSAAGDYHNEISDHQRDLVLVVEDHPELRKFIKGELDEIYDIIEAQDGKEGYELAEKLIPDLIISDIMMPVMDGNTLCRNIKTDIKTSHIPVILLTAKASLDDKLEGLDTGADDYLIKPFNSNELRSRIKNLITLRQQLREKFRTEMIIKPAEVVINPNQKTFIEKLTGIIENHIDNEKFSIEMLCDEIGMSRTQLHRKIKALTNQSTTEFIRNIRLQRAAELIRKDVGNMAEISYMVGFNSQAYFTKSFQDLFGCTPTDYKKKPSEPV
jgi:signal transduction histidine kinase/ligand-binding sensor domain-containing protein/DNA-binding response OmpR family regulator